MKKSDATKRTPGRPKKFEDGVVRMALSIEPRDRANIERFQLRLSSELGKRLSLAESVMVGLGESATYRRLTK